MQQLVQYFGILPVILVASCTCPPADCPARAQVEVVSSTWPAGLWRVEVVAGDSARWCEIEVDQAGAAPRAIDVVCDGVSRKPWTGRDTGWTPASEPMVIELASRLDFEVMQVVVTHGAERWAWEAAPAWSAIGAPAYTCYENCRLGALTVTLPPG